MMRLDLIARRRARPNEYSFLVDENGVLLAIGEHADKPEDRDWREIDKSHLIMIVGYVAQTKGKGIYDPIQTTTSTYSPEPREGLCPILLNYNGVNIAEEEISYIERNVSQELQRKFQPVPSLSTQQ